MAFFKEFLHAQMFERAKRIIQRALQILRHQFRITVRAAERLLYDFINEPAFKQLRRGQSERFGRVRRLCGALPQNGGAASGEITEYVEY